MKVGKWGYTPRLRFDEEGTNEPDKEIPETTDVSSNGNSDYIIVKGICQCCGKESEIKIFKTDLPC